MIPPVWGKALVAAVLALVLLAVGGCGGGSDPPPPGSPSAAEYLVEPAELEKLPEGSPQLALLHWWRSIQYSDIGGYLDVLSAPLRKQREDDGSLREDISLVAGELVRAQPKTVNVQIEGDRATVFTRIAIRTPVGASRYTTGGYPQAFSLVREGSDWKIADDYYFQKHAETIRKAVREAEEDKAASK